MDIPTKPLDQIAKALDSMSEAKKSKIQITYGALAMLLLIANFGGIVDLRKYLKALDSIPRIEQIQEEHGKKINEIMEVLRRNKLVSHELKENIITTAKYD